MDLSALRRAYTGHTPDLMGARGGSAVLVPLVEAPEGTCLLRYAPLRYASPTRSASPAAGPRRAKRQYSAPSARRGRS